MRADLGIVISASHNPFEYNGLKFFDTSGFKLPDQKESEIELLISSDTISDLRACGEEIGRAFRVDDAPGRYIVFVKNTLKKDMTLDGIKIVLDCANGASYKVSPLVFQELGAQVLTIGVNPDGTNINTRCDSLNPDLLKQKVVDSGANLGIALDGDADRVEFYDENGEIVDGDSIIAVLANEMITNGTLSNKTVVGTIMSNTALEKFINSKGCEFVRTQVGDRYVVEEMRERGCNFGGEKSGHLIFLDYSTTGDGTLAALQILSIMKKEDKSLSELAKIIDLLPQVLVNVRVKEKKPIENIQGMEKILNARNKDLNDRGRINIRYSGTEPLARIMVEGEDALLIKEIAEEIGFQIKQEIGE